jgi:hypothetical protein
MMRIIYDNTKPAKKGMRSVSLIQTKGEPIHFTFSIALLESLPDGAGGTSRTSRALQTMMINAKSGFTYGFKEGFVPKMRFFAYEKEGWIHFGIKLTPASPLTFSPTHEPRSAMISIFKDPTSSDLRFEIGEDQTPFTVHRTILKTFAPDFHKLINEGFDPNDVIGFPNIEGDDFKAVLSFIYTDDFNALILASTSPDENDETESTLNNLKRFLKTANF